VRIAVDRRARAPAPSWPKLRVLRFSGKAQSDGIEADRIEGEQVRVFGAPKTIADIFKYRRSDSTSPSKHCAKAGAQSDSRWTGSTTTPASAASSVMRPYLETVVA
jgi:hypothetical protein